MQSKAVVVQPSLKVLSFSTHPFLLECLLRPLLRGATSTELPVFWEPRKEGESHNPFWRNFLYFRIAFRLRLQRGRRLSTQPAVEIH